MRHWLEYTVPDTTGIDLLRGIVICLGAAVLVYSSLTIHFCWTHGIRWIGRWLLAFAVGILAAAQEFEQYGKPMVVWRLPVLIAGVIGALIVMHTPRTD